MAIFFIDSNGALQAPNTATTQPKYTAIELGKPLTVEIMTLAYGDLKDWIGSSEVLVCSWAKTGGLPKPGARLLNVMRTGVKPFELLRDLGAAQYGHRLMFYTPAYDGGVLRLSLEALEIDNLGAKSTAKLGKALAQLGTAAAVFAPQLGFIAALGPDVLQLGRKLYNIINTNDTVLVENCDLSFNVPDTAQLAAGRYLLVRGNKDSEAFARTYKISSTNELVNVQTGKPAGPKTMEEPYAVIRVNSEQHDEYKDFTLDSEAQTVLDEVLNEKEDLSVAIVGVLTDALKLGKRFGSVSDVLKLKQKYDKTSDEAKKAEILKQIETELKFLTEEQSALLRESLSLPVPQNLLKPMEARIASLTKPRRRQRDRLA